MAPIVYPVFFAKSAFKEGYKKNGGKCGVHIFGAGNLMNTSNQDMDVEPEFCRHTGLV